MIITSLLPLRPEGEVFVASGENVVHHRNAQRFRCKCVLESGNCGMSFTMEEFSDKVFVIARNNHHVLLVVHFVPVDCQGV